MKKIEVLGTGCTKCKKTTELIKKVIEDMGVEARVVKVEDIEEIVGRGVMMTPAVMIDGEKMCGGKVPAVKEIKSWFKK
ncbi:MAG: thioredoxin family protein [Halanaerobiaceae bacterium]